MDSLPSPPASLSSGKNPWMVKKHQSKASPTVTTTTTSKLERFISFLLAAWTTLSSVQPVQQQQQQSSFSSPTPPSSSSSSSPVNNTKAVVTRSLLPTMASQCLDLIMFTSAMVITLFSYFSGELDSKKPISSSSSPSSHSHTAQRLVSSASSPSIAIIPPPSRHTIMDIKELRKWQQQQQQQQQYQQPPSIMKRLEYITATCPMDDQNHQRIMAWASSQGYQEQQQESGDTEGGGRQLTSLSLHRQEQHYNHPAMEEVDDDEKYTFDERWSVDGGEPILMNSHHQHHLHLTSPSFSHRQLSSNNNDNNNKYLHPNASSVANSTTTSSSNNNPSPEEDRRLAFMEVQVASLIQQGQAALTKKIKVHELDPKEIAMRRALKQGTSGGYHQ
ncbi:hypothetical protein BCR42DRAFT_219697 [Absidia repens]|uniref:Uncharacterized protein n=1 Tax=Absidia repens TaxID=90262 RepID=A0A1X2INE9_9FUNG|nr:hypothetical protein BCR42DRAFT_219697 [Absidia repens]